MKKKNLCFFITTFALFLISKTSFSQLPDDFPSISVSKTGETAMGYIFLTVSSDVEGVGYYVFMMDDEGNPVQYKKLDNDYAYDFKMQPNGLLSYAQFLSHHSYTGGGNCVHIIMDKEMNILDSLQLQNGYVAEAHDFQLMPNGHKLAFGYYLTQMDLSEIVDGGYPNAMVSGGIVQELDQDDKVVWQWRSWDHYDPQNYTFGRRSNRQTVSEFHLNTINLDTDGNLFLATPSWSKKINRQTGEIMWHLGGYENEFSFVGVDSLDGVSDVTGHAFYRLENGNVLIYDNGPRRGSGTSEAHEYQIDEENKIATKIKTFTPPSDIAAWHRGNAQRMPNGNTLVGWGGASGAEVPTCTEFDADGNVVFEAFFDNPDVESYRAVRFPYPPEVKYEAIITEEAEGNTFRFLQGDTLDIGVEMKATELVSVGYNEITVKTYDYAPEFPRFEGRAPRVIPKRIVVDKHSINYFTADIRFDIDSFGIENPEDITLYFRSTEGEGTFTPLETSYNSVKKQLSATIEEFGEIIFTYPDLEHLVISPAAASPKEGAMVNFQLPVKLEWQQNGFFTSFDLQVAYDEEFTNIHTDTTNLITTIYELNSLPANQNFYWRVKMTNDAGESEWSDVAGFTTVAPFIEITAPNGGEVLQRGLDSFIEWETNTTEKVILSLYKDNELKQVIDTVDNTDAYLWGIPVETDSACGYHIAIRSVADSSISDIGDATFAMNATTCTAIEVPYCKLTSPNGGEILDRRNDVVITWENTTGKSVDVHLYKSGSLVKTLATGIAENSYTWKIADDTENAGDYRIVLTDSESDAFMDASNAGIEITGGPSSIKTVFGNRNNQNLTLYPNPANDILQIEYEVPEKTPVLITFYSIKGVELCTILPKIIQSGKQQIDFSVKGYAPGNYIIQLQYGNKQTAKTITIQ